MTYTKENRQVSKAQKYTSPNISTNKEIIFPNKILWAIYMTDG